mgnify:FL=1
MRGLVREIIRAGVFFMLFAFALSTVVVSLVSGIADLVYHSRRTAAEEEWAAEALASGEEFQKVDYTPNLLTGIASLVLFAGSAALQVLVFMKRLGTATHALLASATLIAAFIFFLPRPPLGTGTDHMRDVFAYLMLLGVFETALFRTYICDGMLPAGHGKG